MDLKKKFKTIKKNVKHYLPEIIIASTVIAGSATLVYICTKLQQDDTLGSPIDEDAVKAMKDGSLTTYSAEDDDYIYTVTAK